MNTIIVLLIVTHIVAFFAGMVMLLFLMVWVADEYPMARPNWDHTKKYDAN